MRFYRLEDWLDNLHWYHWLGGLVTFVLFGILANAMGWVEAPPPGGWQK